MSNDVIFAAAGNGKTYNICNEAIKLASETNKLILLVSYTNEGVHSLEKEYRKQNFGVLDKNVIIKTWYSFLLSELIKPYQCLLKIKKKQYKNEYDFAIPENHIKSIAFYQDEERPLWYKNVHIQYYLNSAQDIRKDSVSHLAVRCIEDSKDKAIERLEAIYSHIFFDELQDYAGWDLEIFLRLFSSEIQIRCVGDYKQATFRTNNSPKYKQYRDERIKDFFLVQSNNGVCELSYSNTTRRFNQEICDFVNTIFNDKESTICPYQDCMYPQVEHTGVYMIDNQYIEQYCQLYNPTILRYDRNSKIKFNHSCQVFNYGNSKGATFERTIIVPVGTVLPFIKEQKNITSNQTRSKFFVACTRAKHSIVFAVDNPKTSSFFKPVSIEIGSNTIPAFRYQMQETKENRNRENK